MTPSQLTHRVIEHLRKCIVENCGKDAVCNGPLGPMCNDHCGHGGAGDESCDPINRIQLADQRESYSGMGVMNTTPEMNAKIVGILRLDGKQHSDYAALRIEELEAEIEQLQEIDEQYLLICEAVGDLPRPGGETVPELVAALVQLQED